jgi:hypothetical protein
LYRWHLTRDHVFGLEQEPLSQGALIHQQGMVAVMAIQIIFVFLLFNFSSILAVATIQSLVFFKLKDHILIELQSFNDVCDSKR